MRISGTTDRGDISGAKGLDGSSEVRERRRGRTTAGEPSEKVSISNRARDVAKAKELASSAPDVNDAKVAELKAAIQNGTYKVDSKKVADKMVDEHLQTMF